MVKGRFTKRKVRGFVRGMRDQAQVSLDCTPSHNGLGMARALGRRDAFDTLLDVLDGDVIEGEPRPAKAKGGE